MSRCKHNLYTARWWYSNCEIKQAYTSEAAKTFKSPMVTVLEPTGPFHEYDPFEFYYSPGSASKGVRSLPYLFADINPDNTEELLAFCQRFGMPGPFKKFESWGEWGSQTFDDPAVQRGITKTRNPYAVQQELLQVSKPVDSSAISSMTLTRLSEEVYSIKNLFILAENQAAPHRTKKWITDTDNPNLLRGWFRPIPANTSEATALLEEMLARGGGQLRLRFVNDFQLSAWTMKWESLSLLSLMYLMVGMDLQGQGQIQTCPACTRLFLAHRAGKTYCSPECQNRFHSLQYYHAKSQRPSKPRRSGKRLNKKG